MMFDLTRPLPDSIVFEGKRWRLRLAFNTVLEVLALLKDPVLFDREKQTLALAMLCRDKNPPPDLLSAIFDECISFTKKTEHQGLRCVDFLQDGAYIYASFMADYGIDLTTERDNLHWWQFMALFQGLSEKTKMREVMRIRREPIPHANKHNGEYIANLIALKQYYALDISQEEREQNFRRGLAGLADALKARAEA
ncbi:MAG: hypothetical protein IJN57_05320 [Oscillospiraceae bacterium]|nr:hypothetical protein [Oscillospiraceae bacterium]